MTRDSGAIAPGRRADLVLLNANPLAGVENVFRREGVMLAGRWFSEDELQSRIEAAAR